MSTTFRNGSATNPGRSNAKELKVAPRPRSPSPKYPVSNESESATARSRSPVKGNSRDTANPPQSIVDTSQQTVKEAVNCRNLENILNMFNDDVAMYKSSTDIVGEAELEKQKVCSKKVDCAQQRITQRETLSGRRQLVSNYSRNMMIPPSKKKNTDEDTCRANASSGKDTMIETASDSSVYLNACATVNSLPSLDYINASDDMIQKGKDLKQTSCKKYLKLIDELCEKIMEESEHITLMQVNEILMQLKWKLLNYDSNVKKITVDNPMNRDSLINVKSSSHYDVPTEESSSQIEPENCKNNLNVSLELSDSDKNNNNRNKNQKSRFPNKDTVKFAGILKLDTSTWNNKNKQKALLNIGTSKEIKFSNLEIDNNNNNKKKVNDNKREKRNEKLSILRPSKSKTEVKDSEQSVRKKNKISDERRLDDRSVEKALNESRSINKERKQSREHCKREISYNNRDHKEILSQIKKSFREYVENVKDKDAKKNVKQIKTKKLIDYQNKTVVTKPLEAHKSKLEDICSSYLNCPESKVNILDADESNAIYDGAFSGENNFKAWLDGKNDIHRDSNSNSKFKEEIIDVGEDRKLRYKSKNCHESKASLLKLAQSQSKIKLLKNSTFSCADSLNTPVESLLTAVDLNQGPIKATNSQLLRISLLKAGSKMSNMSIKSECDLSTTSFRDMKSYEEFIG